MNHYFLDPSSLYSYFKIAEITVLLSIPDLQRLQYSHAESEVKVSEEKLYASFSI